MKMAAITLFYLLLSVLIISTNSRNIPPIHSHSLAPSDSLSPPQDLTTTEARRHHRNPHHDIASSNFTHVCDSSRFASLGLHMAEFAFCDKSLPYSIRAKDLVDSMTISEKVAQLGNKAYGVSRLGLPMYEWWSEALHGVANTGPGTHFDKNSIPGATSFPTVILMAASFNESLWKTIGQVVSTEARAMYNLGLAGLTFWSPNINVVRDPRWGRITETPGEDPLVVGRYAVNYVRGLQDVEGSKNPKDLNSRPLKVAACCKHYAAYDVDNWLGVDRYHFDARVTEQDMVETFLRPFEMCVREGDVGSVMCSYNRVNGIPTCADPKLLSQTIRGEWDLHGYIVADCDSIEVIHHGHKWLNDTAEDAVAQVLRAGMDLDCGTYYTNFTESAILKGKARESDVDKALRNLYIMLMRLGFFDGSPAYASLGRDDVCSRENMDLAAETAREGIVLLKNEGDTLPLISNKYKKLALVGPHANATAAMIGNYAGIPCHYVTPLDAFSALTTVHHEMGCVDVACKNQSFINQAVAASKEADATIIFAGLDLSIEAESLDRTNLLLPGYQTQLITDVANAAVGPVILIILSAGGVDITFAKTNPKINAIIWAGYPGQEGGRAITDIVFGHYNPGGRLPITWYTADYVTKLPMTSMQMRPVDNLGYPGRTYKFFDGPVVYPFGYGLSYTQFKYKLTSAPSSVIKKLKAHQHCHDISLKPNAFVPSCPSVLIEETRCGDAINVEIEVSNVGQQDGSHVILVYSKPPADLVGGPVKQVVEFKRVFVPTGVTKTVKFSIDVCKSLSVVTDTAYLVLPAGEHTIMVGDGDEVVSFPVHVSLHS